MVAHRGGTSEGPENTIEAFENTLKIHGDFIFELDVHQTRDREIAVIHDDSVDRTTNGHGLIQDLKYSEIEKFDAGQGTHIPTLDEVFQTFPKSRVSIDLKLPGYEKTVIDCIKKNHAADRVVLASFSQTALDEARRLAPEIASGFARSEVPRMLLAARLGMKLLTPRKGDVFQIPLRSKGIDVYSKKFLKLAHANSKHVHIWTINDEETMQKLIEDGINGIITDNPRLLFKVASRLKKI